MMFRINYIDGQDNKYTSFFTDADNAIKAIENLYLKRGKINHQVVNIISPSQGLIFSNKGDCQFDRVVISPTEALKLYGDGPEPVLPPEHQISGSVSGEEFAKEFRTRLEHYEKIHGVSLASQDIKQIFNATCQYFQRVSEQHSMR